MPGTPPASRAWTPSPPASGTRWSTSSGTRSWPASRACPASLARRTARNSSPAASCWNLPRPSQRRAPVRRGHERLAHEQYLGARRPPAENPAEDLRPPGQRRHYPGPPRHPRLHRHRPQARQERFSLFCATSCSAPPGNRQHRRSPRKAQPNPNHRSPGVHGVNVYPAPAGKGRDRQGRKALKHINNHRTEPKKEGQYMASDQAGQEPEKAKEQAGNSPPSH